MIRAAAFRQEQRSRRATIGAYMTAKLVRAKRIPRLESLLKSKRRRVEQQSPAEKRAFLRDWALRGKAQGLAIAIGRIDQPFAAGGANG